jgi:hypothetical protein
MGHTELPSQGRCRVACMNNGQLVFGTVAGLEMKALRYAKDYVRRFPRAQYVDLLRYLDDQFEWALQLDSVQMQVTQIMRTARIKN